MIIIAGLPVSPSFSVTDIDVAAETLVFDQERPAPSLVGVQRLLERKKP